MTYTDTEIDAVVEFLEEVARKKLGIKTLKTRNQDRLDFHEVSAASVKEALLAVFEAGYLLGKKKVEL